jgi:hypothetical protein
MGTTNFETVLGALRTSEAVCQAVGLDPTLITQHHASIQRALVEAIKTVHVQWERIPQENLKKIGSALGSYSYVYTTNYDLLIYWAIMSLDAKGFVDYFWTSDQLAFDASNADVWGKATKLLNLHGALHLYRLPSGETVKRKADATDLLDAVGTPYLGSDMPLFVSEGTSAAKMLAIRRSDYLSFAYTTFVRHQGPLVIFGHSLGVADQHLLRALNAEPRLIAISLRRGAPAALTARKAMLHETLPKATLIFFDAATHPLGDPGLRVLP